MKKNLAVANIVLSVSLVAAASLAATAHASDSFYIEIGKPASVEETHEEWRYLSEKYKSILGNLTFYPKTIVNRRGQTASIIQAGPIEGKNKAQKICSSLFAKKIPCFVIEGIEKYPPTMSIGIEQVTNTASGRAFFPWQEEVSNVPDVLAEGEQPAGQDGQISSAEADVDVAQAIAVPLSSDLNSEITQKDIMVSEDKPSINMEAIGTSLKEFSSAETGSLIIKTFHSESDANDFWNHIHNELPDLVEGLRVRVQRPLRAGNNDGIRIKIESFPDGEAAAKFCTRAVGGFDTSLRCRYEIGHTRAANRKRSEPANYPHKDSYENRRQVLQRRLPAQQMDLRQRLVTTHEQTEKKFWAQVAIADSKEEATRRWEEIKKKHADIVDDMPGKIMSSASAHAKYTVRVGPIPDEREAGWICDTLQLRGVDCLMITTN